MGYRIAAFGLALFSATAIHAADPPPKAPPPGSAATYVTAKQLADVMQASIAGGADPALSQIVNTDQYFINRVHRTKAATVNVHVGWTEVHIILEGSGTLLTGGTVKTSGAVKIIEGGVSRRVAKGDVVVLPADTPHQYTAIDGSLDAIEVRFVAPTTGTPAH